MNYLLQLFAALPVYAQTNTTPTVSEVVVTAPTTASGGATFATIVGNIVTIVDAGVIPILFTLAFLFFVYGLVRYLFAEGEENRSKGRQVIMYGLIGLVVMFVVWGLVDILLATLNSVAGTSTQTTTTDESTGAASL